MADAQRVIEIIFEGVDKTSAATQAVISNMDQFAGNVQSATQPIADFTAGALKLEAALLTAGLAVTGFSIKVASDFQSAVADLQKVLSDTDDIEQYKDLALELSTAYGVASTDVLNSIANYKQAGFTAQEAAQLTKSGLDLVIAGNVDAATASDQLVASLKGFGVEAQRSTELVDLLNEVSNNYAATTGQLLEGFSTLSPVAQTAGFSLQETIAILTPGIEVFQSGSEVANALRTSLIRLVDDSKPVQDALATLGVNQRDANGELRSARDIYFDVAEALQDLDQNQQLYIAGQLVGIQRSSQFLATTQGLSKTLVIASEDFDFLGSAAKEVAIQLGTAENQANRVRESFTNLFVVIGEPLLDEFSGIADAIISIFGAIGQSVKEGEGGLGEITEFVEAQMLALEATLRQIAENLPAALELADFSGFIDGVASVTDSVSGLFDSIDLSTPEGLAEVITFLGEAFEALSEFSAGAIESFGPLFDLFLDISRGVAEMDDSLVRSLGRMGGLAEQANILSGALVSLLPAVEGLIAVIGINQTAGLVKSLFAASSAIVAAGGGGLVGALTSLSVAAGGLIVGGVIGTLANELTELATGTSLSTRVTDWAISLGLLDDEATRIAESLNDATPSVENLAAAASKAGGDVKQFATELKEIVPQVGTIYDLSGALSDAGESSGNLLTTTTSLKGTFSVIADETLGAAGAVDRLNEASDEIRLQEKLALIEAQTAITTAQIEANARQMVAAFESVSETIGSTGDSITELFGLLGDDDISKLDKLDISNQIELENQRRQEALELQERLTEAQIRALNAQTERLRGDKALIEVNGDGLEPLLEAMFFQIMEGVQIRVSNDGLGLLLGLSV